jgi:hypothetical protein
MWCVHPVMNVTSVMNVMVVMYANEREVDFTEPARDGPASVTDIEIRLFRA